MVGADAQAEEAYKDYGVNMKNLFNLVQPVRKHDAQIVQVRGLNLTDNYPDGAIEWSHHVSLDRFPYITSWTPPEEVSNTGTVDACTSWSTPRGNLIYFSNGHMFIRSSDTVAVVNHDFLSGPKQFAVLQNKLVVWPDKVYVNLQTLEAVPLAQTIVVASCSFAAHSMTLYGSASVEAEGDLTTRFHVDDMVRISDLEDSFAANNGWYRVSEVEAHTLHFSMPEEQSFVTGSVPQTQRPVVQRVIPDLDYITVQNNRLWGVDNDEQTIWSSVQGDPTNFYTYKGVASDAGAIPVSSSGDFTGITALGTQVLAFKEDRLYKVLGMYPEEYHTYEYQIDGVAQGCSKSMVIINDALYYMSPHGVMVYQGQQPVPISAVLGPDGFDEAVAGTDGLRYYITFKPTADSFGNLYSYDTRLGIWMEDARYTKALDFTRIGSDCYMLDSSGEILKLRGGDSSDSEIGWHLEFKKFYEASTGSDNKYMVAPVLKRYHRLIFRVDIPEGSTIQVRIAYDDDAEFQTIATITGKKGIASYPVPIAKCDSFRLYLVGTGPGTVLQIVREFSLGTTR